MLLAIFILLKYFLETRSSHRWIRMTVELTGSQLSDRLSYTADTLDELLMQIFAYNVRLKCC